MKQTMKKQGKTMKNMKMKTITKKVKAMQELDKPMQTAPMIDKITLIVDMPDAALHGCLLKGLIENSEDLSSDIKKANGSSRYPTTVELWCPDHEGLIHKNGPLIHISATKVDHPDRQVRLEFNPMKLLGWQENVIPHGAVMLHGGQQSKMAKTVDDPVVTHLDIYFQELFAGLTFFEVLHYARVTRIDICRHILCRSLEDYLFKVKNSKSSHSFFGTDGKLGSLYAGKATGTQFVFYDKAKQIDPLSGNSSVRVEARLKLKKFPVHKLWGLDDPFQRVMVNSLHHPKPPLGLAHWIAFRDSCRFRGVSNAIKMQPKSVQGKLKKAISDLPVSWWQMNDDDWSATWHEALAESWLNLIPDNAPPLTMAWGVGIAA